MYKQSNKQRISTGRHSKVYSPSGKKLFKICAMERKETGSKSTIEQAKVKLDEFEEKWSDKYPHIGKSWRANWEELMAYFDYPVEIRKLLYTTNIIESVNSKLRKATDGKRVFPSDESLLKSLYIVSRA